MQTRRKFILSISSLGISYALIKPTKILAQNRDFTFQSPFMGLNMNIDYPGVESLWIDSLGKNKKMHIPLIDSTTKGSFKGVKKSNLAIQYRLSTQTIKDPAAWEFNFSKKKISIESKFTEGNQPFEIMVSQELNHTTVLGIMIEKNIVQLPCLIHFPDMGTFRVTSVSKDASLFFDTGKKIGIKEKYVQVALPAATAKQKKISYQLEVVAIHPAVAAKDNDSFYDSFKKNFINIFQVNPRLQVLANNSSSDPCAFTVYQSAELAKHTPALAEGFKAMHLVRMTLDRYLNGMKGYGLVGYTDNYEGTDSISWKSPYDSLDSYPSLLLASCYYIENEKDYSWAVSNLSKLSVWAENILCKDIDGDGLIEYELSGNSGTWNNIVRPSNWWDTIGFGHKDAYSNAIAFKALSLWSGILERLKNDSYKKYSIQAKKIKSVYYNTFYNTETGVLAGWKSADGNLHDYYFTFINGIAITYGLIEQNKANAIMDKMLAKFKSIGYTNFSLGLPGNLIPIRKEDYTTNEKRWGGPSLEDGSDSFQIYENGGATSCHVYFTIKALQILDRKIDADMILRPMIEALNKSDFSGKCTNGMSKDWKKWNGECWGYEGFLCDGYLFLLNILD